MTSKRITFENSDGLTLAAHLELPVDGRPVGYAVFAHCFTCGKDLKAAARISRSMAQHGFGVLRFDFTGIGESEGDFAQAGFSTNVSDLVAAANYLGRRHQAPKVLIGHSLGGSAVLKAAAEIPSAVAVVTIGAPAEPSHVKRLLKDPSKAAEASDTFTASLAGRAFTVGQEFLDDLDAHSMEHAIHELRRALLILHSPLDRIVGIGNAETIFRGAMHPKSFVSLDQADHLLSSEGDAEYAAVVIAAWASKYLDVQKPDVESRPDAEKQVVVHTGASGYRSDVLANGHALVADEPESVGGTNAGPSPYEYLLAALGSCTGMTIRMYADRKQWPVEGVTVRLSHGKIHAEDCENCETREGRVDHIDREIELEGPLDASQRQRLLEIADRCPVHRTLQSEIVVDTHLRED